MASTRRQLTHPLAAVLTVLATTSVLMSGTPGTASVPASVSTSLPPCGTDQVSIGLAPGLPSMHTVSFLIEVHNTSGRTCELDGLPRVSLLDSAGQVRVNAAGSPLQPSTSLSSHAPLRLKRGETATAQLVETTPVGTTSCPSYPEVSVGLGVSGMTRVLHRLVFACPSTRLDITDFVPGFDGTSPGGELVGTAPSCATAARSPSAVGPVVNIEAWSGPVVAGLTSVYGRSKAGQHYHITLPAGRYRVTSAHTSRRGVVIKLGQVTNLGRFGGCSTIATATTVPGSGATTTTTPPLTPAPTDRLTRIAFLSPSFGYGLFTRQTATTCAAVVGSSTDGGAVFGSLVSVVSWSCPSQSPVSQLAFDNHGDGFLYGPDLFVTHDSGATWTQLPQSGVVMSVEALGSSVWTVETTCATAATLGHPCSLRLLESQDGGKSWGTVPVPTGATSSGVETGQTYLVRISTTSAYLASNPPFFAGPGPPSIAPLWFTVDGGKTWSTRQVDCGVGSLMDSISVAPDGTLVAVCASQPSAGSQPKSTVRSSDGARTWTTMTPCSGSTSLTFACTTTQPLAFGYLGEIDAVSSSTVYLVGGRSSLLVTHNGGVSWQIGTPMIGDTSDGSWDVTFFNSVDGLVLGSDPSDSETRTIWSTTNGGASWRSTVPIEATTPAKASAFAASSVSFTSPQDGWVLGVAPCSNRVCTRLLRTTDAGSTWTQVRAPPAPLDTSKPSGVNELHFANREDAYAFGGTALWVTHDGGAHWRDLTSVGGLRRYVVGSLVSTTTGVFALVSGYGGPPGLGVGGADTPWRIVHAASRSNRFRVVATLTGNAGVPLMGTLAAADGTVYALDGASILRLAGKSTSSSRLPPGHDCEGPIAAWGAGSLLLVCGQGAADGSMGNREVFGTTDAGRSWTQLADPGMGAGYDTMSIADGGNGRATISTVSAGEGGLLNTTDDATSWTQAINFRGQEGEPFIDVSYQSSSQAVAVYGPVQARAVEGQPFNGIGALFKTTDGGQTWVRVTL
jgi:photosystem II stability/assembly factor-like uncharacterized protein